MILIYAIAIILFEAIGEGLLKKNKLCDFIFKWWVQWLIAIVLFLLWFFVFTTADIPIWKLVTGFVFVRFAIFDVAWNLARGVKWNYYGSVKLYDRIMFELAEWGWMMKIICGIVGIIFLMGWQ